MESRAAGPPLRPRLKTTGFDALKITDIEGELQPEAGAGLRVYASHRTDPGKDNIPVSQRAIERSSPVARSRTGILP